MLSARRNVSRSLVAGAHKTAAASIPASRRTMALPSWTDHPDRFPTRHNGLSADDETVMLKAVGASSKEQLMSQVVPKQISGRPPLIVGKDMTEMEALEKLEKIAKKNKIFNTYIGMGYYNTVTPPVVLRNIIQNPGWYTPYTPYQAEISQGRMESLVNYQTMLTELTGMPIAQSSLLDESTAAAEAMAMCQTITKGKKPKFFLSSECNPQTIDVCKVRADPMGIEIVLGDPHSAQLSKDFMGIMMPYPATDGSVQDYTKVIAHAKEHGVNTIFIADLLSLTMLKPPGEQGVDIVVGNSQRFGVPLGFGGPHAAFMACKDEHKRAVPGRIIGKSIDASGNLAYRLTLQAREQHIRREKANSNICTAQALLANTAAFYAIYHGPKGLKKIAERVNGLAKGLQAGLKAQGFAVGASPMFDTVKVTVADAAAILKTGVEHKINLRMLDAKTITVALDETTGVRELEVLLAVFGKHGSGKAPSVDALLASVTPGFDGALKRTSAFMQQKVFNSYQTETEMMRYMFHLQSKDYGLNTGMVPLGSCTMKLNSVSEMIPVTWPEFNSIHPFVPPSQTEGYKEMLDELAKWLIDITGFHSMSLQPNAGASGEYAGLMCIREYHLHRGDKHRNICLIPRAAHGTNPATAAMCGMEVIPIECDEDGNTDVKDLADKVALHKANLGALMITYPSTHGVFEESIKEVCQMVHAAGGLVYMDGANMNAQVGFTSPGHIGADVCHLNLHKTFCIPHGGGGPGMGPIGVVERLAPFLPGHTVIKTGGDKAMGAVSAAPYGSASILPISWMYIQCMGTKGLENATYQSILSANYIADQLKDDFKILFRGKQGRAAHEFILDLRPFKESCGIDGVDVAKRLIDYSLHAPTMSWPVAGTLMCEPTESESKFELDRFITAMKSIRKEIALVESGKMDKLDNPLKNAPHTKEELMGDKWTHAYSRELAAYPLESLRRSKFWPTVKRVDDVYGDKNVNVTHKE